MSPYPLSRCFAFALATGILMIAGGQTALSAEGPSAPAEAAETGATGEGPSNPVIEAVYVELPPEIDGQLDDPCWATATRVENFYCSEWDAPAPEETIALICADGDAIYVAVICNDSTPQDIVADETRRGGDMAEDDRIRVWLDPTQQYRNYYAFDVNARGTQAEGIPGGSATKIEWRGDWIAAAGRTDAGWQAEVAIPFSILRYPPEQTTFAFAVARQFARERVNGVWPDMGPTDDLTLAADLVGVHPVAEAPRPILMPYVTIDSGDTEEEGIDAGLDVQYQLPSGLTALGVINPDFSQIEDVVEPISFSYTERYLRDPRPFFVTGQSDFLPREHLFYTRRVQDFDAGLKLFGTVGNETIGILDAVTFGEDSAFAGAWKHQFDEDNWTRISAVSHQPRAEPDNFASELAAGRTWRHPDGTDSMWAVLYDSRTQGTGSGSSYAVGGSHNRGFGNIQYDWMLRRVTDDFSPSLGYYPDVNNIGGELNLQQIDFFEKGPVEARQWQLNMQYYPYLDGDGIFSSSLSPGYFVRTRSAHLYGLILNYGRYFDYDNSDITAICGWNDADLYRRGEINFVRGKRAGGNLTYYKLDQGLRPMDRLSVRVGGEYIHLAMPDDSATHQYQAVLTTSYDITPERTLAARAIWRDGGFSAYAAYRQVVRRGMDAYVIVGDPNPTLTGFTSRIALKLIWAL
jgi:hypothetical protein